MLSTDEKETLIKTAREILFDTVGLISFWMANDVYREVVKAITRSGLALTRDETRAIVRAVPQVEHSLMQDRIVIAARRVLDDAAAEHPIGISSVEDFNPGLRSLGRLIDWNPTVDKG